MKPVSLVAGRVYTEAVEINAVWHCNISCQSCSHGSPSLPRDRFADPATVTRDLHELSAWMRVEHVRVLGGEPLLHPEVEELLVAIRRTEITDTVRVLTNGLLLHCQTSAFWREVDELHISVYPNTTRAIESQREQISRRAEECGTRLTLKYFDHFRVSFRPPDDDEVLTGLIYATCQVGNRWRCLTVEDGTLYRCPQSAMLARDSEAVHVSDGLRIGGVRHATDLLAWIERPTPLLSCSECTGSAGLKHRHQMCRMVEEPATSDLVDRTFLTLLQADPDADNGCVRPEHAEGH